MTIRILLADDQALIRGGFAALIGSAADMQVVGEAADGASALDLARSLAPDVVLMDIRMPGMDGISATQMITSDPELRDVKVLVLTTFEADDHVLAALRAGASGFLGKGVEPRDLLEGIRVVAAGDALLSPRATRGLIDRYLAQPTLGTPEAVDPALDVLTERERGGGSGRPRVVQRRHRQAAVHVAADGQDPRQPVDDQARGSGPSPAGRHRLPERADACWRGPTTGAVAPRACDWTTTRRGLPRDSGITPHHEEQTCWKSGN